MESITPYSMFMGADWIVKSVMILLLLTSIISWSLLLAKKLELTQALNNCVGLKLKLGRLSYLEEAKPLINRQRFESKLIEEAIHECRWGMNNESSRDGIKERLMQRLISTQSDLSEKAGRKVGVFASIGSTAPFIGLFGTVWGIMNSFIGIAAAKNTNLAVVAPGIAEALLATAAGLVAAIPAVLFYNYFSRLLASYKKQLTSICSDLVILASRELEKPIQRLAKVS